MGIIKRTIFHTIAIALIFWAIEVYLFPGKLVMEGGMVGYVLLALVFGFLNGFVKPVLKILTFPIHFISLGLSSFLLNGVILWFGQFVVNFLAIAGTSLVIEGGIVTYIILGLFLMMANMVLHWFEK